MTNDRLDHQYYLGHQPGSFNVSLANFTDMPVWVAWAEDPAKSTGKPTKKPYTYSRTGESYRLASSTDPSTWLTLDKAAAVSKLLIPITKGVGIVLGIECDGDLLLGGVDLDSCIDTTGTNATWASEIIERFDSYTEISPSLTGAKILFRFHKSDLSDLRALMGGRRGKSFKQPSTEGHPPGIEVYTGDRYFTVTQDALPDMEEIRVVNLDDLKWLIVEAGPAIVASGVPIIEQPTYTNGKSYTNGKAHTGPVDQSRSGVALRLAKTLRRLAWVDTYEELRDALISHPTTMEWMHEKGLANVAGKVEREFRRIWEKSEPTIGEQLKFTDPLRNMRDVFAAEQEESPGPPETPNGEETPEKPAAQQASPSWGDPVDLFGSLTPEPILTAAMLPKTIADFASVAAQRIGVCMAAVAIPALIVCASAIDGRITIQPRHYDTEYCVSALLWAMGIGDPGTAKTPALNAATKPLEEIERSWRIEDADKVKQYERDYSIYKQRLKKWENMMVNPTPGIGAGSEPVEPEEPKIRRLLTTDYTMEALAEIHLKNERHGLMLKVDELAGFIGAFDAYRAGRTGKDRAAALEYKTGKPRAIDRVNRAELVPFWGGCIIGNIQNNKLASIAPNLTDDGLMQRFLVYNVNSAGMALDRVPDRKALDGYMYLIEWLVTQRPCGEPFTVAPEGQQYRQEVERLTYALANSPAVPPALRAHARKLDGFYGELLLVMHLIEWHQTNKWFASEDDIKVVSVTTAKRARDLMVLFLIPSAVRIYTEYFSTQNDETGRDARWIAGHILAHKLERFSDRDIYRANNRTFQNNRERLKRALAELVNLNWLKTELPQWVVNPLVHVRYAERAEQEQQQREFVKTQLKEQAKTLKRAYG
jgi:hypothetical protein